MRQAEVLAERNDVSWSYAGTCRHMPVATHLSQSTHTWKYTGTRGVPKPDPADSAAGVEVRLPNMAHMMTAVLHRRFQSKQLQSMFGGAEKHQMLVGSPYSPIVVVATIGWLSKLRRLGVPAQQDCESRGPRQRCVGHLRCACVLKGPSVYDLIS